MAELQETLLTACRRVLGAVLPERYLVSQWVDEAAVAFSFMLVMLAFVRVAGFSSHVRGARREMLAHAYALLVYYRSPRMILRSEARLVRANLKLLLFLLPTLLFGGLLFAGALETLTDRYAAPALPVGENFVVRVRSAAATGGLAPDEGGIEADAVAVEQTGRVRSRARGTVWTRLRALRPGLIQLHTGAGGGGTETTVNVASPANPVRRWHYADDREIYIGYPKPHGVRAEYGWLAPFLVFCGVSGVPLSRALGVRL